MCRGFKSLLRYQASPEMTDLATGGNPNGHAENTIFQT